MKKATYFLAAFLIASAVLLSGFSTRSTDNGPVAKNLDEFELLVTYLEQNGNFINTKAPTLILANEVRKNLKNQKYHIIDIRSESWFDYGHIRNAHNVQPANLLNYFENKIDPKSYDKIVLICYSGQSAAYYTSLLRLAGYDNVYSMKWGMSSWRADFAENSWLKNVSNNLSGKLETKPNTKLPSGGHPEINTGKTTGKDILHARLEELFKTPYKESIVKCMDIYNKPSDCYIITCCPEELYEYGHLPGTVKYDLHSFSSDKDLYTLPADRKVVVYDETGQGGAYLTAYLNLLGYKTGNIAYGANAFMNKDLKAKGWDAFSKKQVNMYPVIE